MRKLETLIKTISEAEQEIYTYSDKEIQKAIDKYNKKHGIIPGILIETIYQGLDIEE